MNIFIGKSVKREMHTTNCKKTSQILKYCSQTPAGLSLRSVQVFCQAHGTSEFNALKHNQTTSGELLSNVWKVVGFVSSEPRFSEASFSSIEGGVR